MNQGWPQAPKADTPMRFWFGRTRDCEGPYQLLPWVRPLWDQALRGQWDQLLESVAGAKPWHYVNAFCPWHEAHHSFLHLAAEQGADQRIVERMIEMGAWRSLQNGKGQRPIDVARKAGSDHLVEMLKPCFEREVPFAVLLEMQHHFHGAMRRWDNLGGQFANHGIALPQLQPMLEGQSSEFRFEVFFWHGGFNYELFTDGPQPRLRCFGFSRVAGGTEGLVEITMSGVKQLPWP